MQLKKVENDIEKMENYNKYQILKKTRNVTTKSFDCSVLVPICGAAFELNEQRKIKYDLVINRLIAKQN